MDNKVTLEEFEQLVSNLPRDKYHIHRLVDMVDNKSYVTSWSIFRKDGMTTEEYLSPYNKAILDSKHNDVEDIKKLVKMNYPESKISKTESLIVSSMLSNIFFDYMFEVKNGLNFALVFSQIFILIVMVISQIFFEIPYISLATTGFSTAVLIAIIINHIITAKKYDVYKKKLDYIRKRIEKWGENE